MRQRQSCKPTGSCGQQKQPAAEPAPRWYETPEFLEERKKWYDRLKEDGFRDIENIDWSTGRAYGEPGVGRGMLKGVNQKVIARAYDPSLNERSGVRRLAMGPEYWDFAAQWTWTIEDSFAQRIWTLWADGLKMVQIAAAVGLRDRKVSAIVRRIEAQMLEALRDGSFDEKVGNK